MCIRMCMQFHSDAFKGRAAAVIPADEYQLLRERAASAPLFVLPLGKGQGRSLSMLLQWQMPHALFTGLDDYRACALSVTVTSDVYTPLNTLQRESPLVEL